MPDREFIGSLNTLLIDIYANISKIESEALKKHGEGNLSISEFHILESIASGGGEGRTIGEIAQDLSVTFPTITVAVNKLEKKDCVTKNRSESDGRVVRITLTRQGRRMNAMHRYFHERMACEMCRGADRAELDTLMTALNRLNCFLKTYTDTNTKADKQ